MRYLFLFYTFLFACLFACPGQSYWIYQEAEEYYEGTNGREQSYEKAFVLYKKAADMGNPLAEYKLALCYWKGHGVTESSRKAFKYAKKSAKKGNDRAQELLGFLYFSGDGCKKSFKKAMRYYFRAADQGNESAIKNLQQIGWYKKITYMME